MPPRARSRYALSGVLRDADGRAYVEDHVPFRFRELDDNRRHVVTDGDTLFTVAARFFAPMDDAANFWWAIADFQPDPILDPTLRLSPGTILVVPSHRTLVEEILSEKRRGRTE